MDPWMLENESWLRLSVFLTSLAVMMGWQTFAPFRPALVKNSTRWLQHLYLILLDTLALRLFFATGAVGAALWAQEAGWGLFQALHLNPIIEIVAAVVALDLVIYFQHILMHKVPLLWRLHQVHHTDRDFDATTAIRFHPIEIVLSMVIKYGAILALGAPVTSVVLFEIILSSMALFNHANIQLPARLEWLLRLFVVTPGMHRIHHSTFINETNSNYGFNISLWDRLFKTYVDRASLPQEKMTIGLEGRTEDSDVVSIKGLLLMPFRSGRRQTPGNSRNKAS